MEEETIKELLIQVLQDQNKVLELTKYPFETILDVAFENKLYDSLYLIVQPINIDGEYKYYFKTAKAIYNKISGTYLKEEAINEAQVLFYEYKESYDSFEQCLEDFESETITKEEKDFLINLLDLYSKDINSKVKIKNTHEKAISGTTNPINSPVEVLFYSECACQKACMELFYKGIQTTSNDTECVHEDYLNGILNGKCDICINYSTLSQENKLICDELAREGLVVLDDKIGYSNKNVIEKNLEDRVCFIRVKCNAEDTIEDVSQRFDKIISRFQEQDILYGNISIYDILECDLSDAAYDYVIEFYDEKAEGVVIPDNKVSFLPKLLSHSWINAYYDADEETIWRSKTLYDMHKNYLKTLDNNSIKL